MRFADEANAGLHGDELRTWLQKRGVSNPLCFSWIPIGWTTLVDRLISALLDAGWDAQLMQVKEKFGGLRFYTINQLDEDLQQLVQGFQQGSFRQCSLCELPGELCVIWRGRLQTLCEAHQVHFGAANEPDVPSMNINGKTIPPAMGEMRRKEQR